MCFVLGARLLVPWRCASGKHAFWLPQQSRPGGPDGNGSGGANDASEPCFETLLHSASRAGQDHVVEWILHQAKENRRPGRSASPDFDLDAEAQLVCHCPSPHMDVGDGNPSEACASPLHLALIHGHHSTAKILMRHGAVWDRCLSFSLGVTGLHIMAATGATDLIEWVAGWPCRLLAQNAPMHDWPDERGFSSLHYACLAPNGGGGGGGDDKDEVKGGGGMVRDQQDAQAARLVSNLLGLGAVLETQNRQEAEQRLERERVRIWGPHWGSDSWAWNGIDVVHWPYRLAFWEQRMEPFEFAQMEPAAFAAARGNQPMARALQAAADRKRRDEAGR
ncbi:hypothetical protein LY78DRAFT_425368 [Colletotrichum sublineola]|nr:hypothetical protein LY78DRAFT_425368 [Colletotrichum sublineola]